MYSRTASAAASSFGVIKTWAIGHRTRAFNQFLIGHGHAPSRFDSDVKVARRCRALRVARADTHANSAQSDPAAALEGRSPALAAAATPARPAPTPIRRAARRAAFSHARPDRRNVTTDRSSSP